MVELITTTKMMLRAILKVSLLRHRDVSKSVGPQPSTASFVAAIRRSVNRQRKGVTKADRFTKSMQQVRWWTQHLCQHPRLEHPGSQMYIRAILSKGITLQATVFAAWESMGNPLRRPTPTTMETMTENGSRQSSQAKRGRAVATVIDEDKDAYQGWSNRLSA